MRILWATDIHLNFLDIEASSGFCRSMKAEGPDIALLGGDIAESGSIQQHLQRIEYELLVPTYFVLGNHDFYGGSIASVRKEMRDLCLSNTRLIWLSESGVISLSPSTGLIGHDSWGDGRLGDYATSRVELNDFHLIDELRNLGRVERLYWMRTLGDQAAEHFRKVLPLAVELHEQTILLTHVPPFRESVWHQGRISGDEWLPFFGCRSVGEVLLEVMREHPDRSLLVLCGHTHGSGQVQVLPNLSVITGGATYGRPAIQTVLEFE